MKKKDEKPKSEEKYKDREDAFRAYFEIITKIVYTLNLISDRNDMTRRLSSNIDRALGYDDEVVSNNEKTLNNANEIDLLVNSLKGDVRKISTFKKYNFNIEKFISERELNLDERFILYSVLVYTIYGDSMSAISIRRILELITLNSDIYINKYHYFDSKSKLMSSGIFVLSHEPYPSGGILEISNTLVTFVNSKVIFAFLEKDNYGIIEGILNNEEVIRKYTSENKFNGKKKSSESAILTPNLLLGPVYILVVLIIDCLANPNSFANLLSNKTS